MSAEMNLQYIESVQRLRQAAHGLNVLYVEDDPIINREYRTFLSRFFENIDTASDGLEGLKATMKKHYDLIITDIRMPRMSGLDMIEQIRERNPKQAILLVSAYNDVEFLHRAVNLGVDGYLFKPINRSGTIETLQKIVAKIRHENDNLHYKSNLEVMVAEKAREVVKTYTVDRISNLGTLAKLEQDIHSFPGHSLVMLKIGDFKHLNDTYGYDAGNSVLQQTAEFLKSFMHGEERIGHFTLYRTSGAHFVLLTSADVHVLEPIVHTVVQQFESTDINLAGEYVYLEMYAAIAPAHDDMIISHVDFALRQAEQTKQIVIYRNEVNQHNQSQHKLKCIDSIKRALQEKRFVPFYQPIVENTSKTIRKYEALARLILPNGEPVSPASFLAVAKETKMYNMITRMIVESALHDFRDSECSVSINLSIDDIMHQQTREYIFAQIETFPEPERLVFELLESEGAHCYVEIQLFFNQLKRRGCKVAIDDFGSGYSNFERLVKLNIDYIKIDGSLIRNIDTDYTAQTIVEMLISFASRMKIKTIAEFVSNESVSAITNAMGVTESQGYLYGAPTPFNLSMLRISELSADTRL